MLNNIKMKKTIRLTEDDLTRIVKRVIEASEVMPKNDPMMTYIKDIFDSVPEFKLKQYCSKGKIDLAKVESRHMEDLQKMFGDQTSEIIDSYKKKTATMDKNSILNLVKTLRTLIKKPNEFVNYIKNFSGIQSKTPVNESLLFAIIAFGVFALIALYNIIPTLNFVDTCTHF